MQTTMTTTMTVSGSRSRISWALATSAIPAAIVQVLFRLAIASVFLKAGASKHPRAGA